MALQTSGAISFANLQSEFGGSHPITMGEYASHRVSGSGNTISMNQFYGASASLDTQTVTVGYQAGNQYVGNIYGFSNSGLGSITDGTCNFKSLASYAAIYFFAFNSTNDDKVYFMLNGIHANNGWTTMNVGGSNFNRSSASFTTSGNTTYWYWTQEGLNPFGTTVGATKVVTFT